MADSGESNAGQITPKQLEQLALEADDAHSSQFVRDLREIHPQSTDDLRKTLGDIATERGKLVQQGKLPQGDGIGVVERAGNFKLAGKDTHIIIPADIVEPKKH